MPLLIVVAAPLPRRVMINLTIRLAHMGYRRNWNMESSQAAAVFAALSQETRVDLIRLLIGEGPNGLPAGDIVSRLRLPNSTVSFHLAALERAGLTQATRQGRQIVHAVRIAGVRSVLGFLAEACCGGRPELCGDIARLLPPFPDEDPGMTPGFNVLFLCTHNSARSIIAEAILGKIGGGRFHPTLPVRTRLQSLIPR